MHLVAGWSYLSLAAWLRVCQLSSATCSKHVSFSGMDGNRCDASPERYCALDVPDRPHSACSLNARHASGE